MRPLLAIAAALLAGPAAAVGLGPLAKSGITDGPAKAFYLTVMNPYPAAEQFEAYAIGPDDETEQTRVSLFPSDIRLGGGQSRQILVIARNIAPGETFAFRVCAARRQLNQGPVHARVCSKLSARRIAGA